LLEAAEIGGTSLNRGPAPVRTLARAARLVRDWSSWAAFGLEGAPPVPDLHAVLANSARVARHAHDKKDITGQLRSQGVEVIDQLGAVWFAGPHELCAADGRRWPADSVVIATGGHAARLSVPGGENALTYDAVRSLEMLPDDVAVVGGADTGCQLASIFADFGVTVRMLEATPQLLPGADASVSAGLRHAFEARGMRIHTDSRVLALGTDGQRIVVSFSQDGAQRQLSVAAVFAAIGWPANIDELDLEAAGVLAKPHAIPVDAYLRTNVAHLFAVGDVNGQSKLVQSARLEGRVAAWNAINGPTRTATHDVMPSGSFTDPEYGAVGMTEAAAARHHDIVVGIADYDDLLRPVADGQPDGFCKLIVDRREHRILGAHVLGEYSAETVQVVATAMSAGMSIERLAEMPFAFPTFTEGVSMAAQKVCRELGVGRFPMTWSPPGSPL
jgi:pyruvate/2-oxoglutarate dehydrogenase complex dihydrolipoamide dehydrogenase (E3) component